MVSFVKVDSLYRNFSQLSSLFLFGFLFFFFVCFFLVFWFVVGFFNRIIYYRIFKALGQLLP